MLDGFTITEGLLMLYGLTIAVGYLMPNSSTFTKGYSLLDGPWFAGAQGFHPQNRPPHGYQGSHPEPLLSQLVRCEGALASWLPVPFCWTMPQPVRGGHTCLRGCGASRLASLSTWVSTSFSRCSCMVMAVFQPSCG